MAVEVTVILSIPKVTYGRVLSANSILLPSLNDTNSDLPSAALAEMQLRATSKDNAIFFISGYSFG